MRSLAPVNLSGGVIAFVLILARTIPGWAQSHYKIEDVSSMTWSDMTLHDPSPGTKVVGLSSIPGMKALLVVGDCGECNRSKVAAFVAADLPPKVRRVVLVPNGGSKDDIEALFGKRPGIVYEPLGEKLKAALNVTFMPRVYLLDGSGALRYAQSPSLSYGQAFWTLGRSFRAGH